MMSDSNDLPTTFTHLRKEWIIYEDENIIVLNKPSGLYSIPDRKQLEKNCKDLLVEKYGSIFTVHRLDAATSGIILFAKNEAIHKEVSYQFENRLTQKIYAGIVHGVLPASEGVINAAIAEHPAKNGTMIVHRNGKEAITLYKVIKDFKRYSLVEFDIQTGRTHQIRVHCKNIGNPIIGDELYGDGKGFYLSSLKKKFNLGKYELEEKPLLNRLALHAQRLTVTVNNQVMTFETTLPKDMAVTVKQLEKNFKP
jgi:23S rRNA pseudouridine1911/1915/1917 synthase